MRICIDARPIINKQTGLGRYTYNLINALKKVDDKNEYLILVHSNLASTHPVFNSDNSRFQYKKCPIPGVTVQQQYKLDYYLRTEHFDVYHYPHFDLPIALSKKYRSVFTVHDLTYLLHRSVFRGAEYIKKFYTKQIMKLGIKFANRIITVSETTKKDLTNYFNVPQSKMVTIYEACEPIFVPINDREIINKFKQKWNLKNPFFLFIGEKRPHKNLIRQIEAFDLFQKKTAKKFDFIIIGKSYKNYFNPEERAKQLNLKSQVRFLGYVEDYELPLFYNCAEAFMFPSLYEGFGIPILESFSCGTPVITSNISSTQEIAGGAALLVNPYKKEQIAEAMVRIITNVNLRQNYITKGFKQIKLFSWEIAALKTLRLYQQII